MNDSFNPNKSLIVLVVVYFHIDTMWDLISIRPENLFSHDLTDSREDILVSVVILVGEKFSLRKNIFDGCQDLGNSHFGLR